MNFVLLYSPALASVVFAFRQSNIVGQVIVAILFFGSILAWSVMLIKINDLRVAVRDNQRFQTAFNRETRLNALIDRKQQFPNSPIYQVYAAVCRRWQTLSRETNPTSSRTAVEQTSLTSADMSVLRGESEKHLAIQELALDDNMGLLATAVAAAPFLGLLGTVWGVMEAFIGMAMAGSALLSAVAPGISAALLTTVVGLLVALPSLIGHNYLVNRIRRSTMEMHNFAEALLADIERQYGAAARASHHRMD